MATMGTYCKAYPLHRLRQFDNWRENTQNLRPTNAPAGGQNGRPQRTLTGDDCLFLQENFTVTDGIFLDEYVVFDRVTPEWKEFCQETLKFEVPA
ncbi:MAG TPA: hypothetical protein VGV59_04530 [Pyrinomonadaceae bacterium]|nr:hypothetical protein [Pyrinomonadaceae bacterium]